VIDAADRLEIDQLACSIPITGGRWATPAEVRECNDGTLAAMRRYPDRILGYCFLNPGHAREALEELDRCVVREGMIGVKLYNQYKINDPVVFPVIERSIELGVPILSHAGRLVRQEDIAQQPLCSHAGDFVDVGCRYPEAMIIHGHIAGGGDWQWTLKVLREAPTSIYLDTSGSVMDNGLLERCVRDFGEERLLFATDMTMEGGVARVRDAQITEGQREKIFFRNFQAILARRKAG
jgi:predicted TIM-barrel fold metal-dependent hydrolase